MSWQRVNIGNNRRYLNTDTGETISKRQYSKLYPSLSQAAKEARQSAAAIVDAIAPPPLADQLAAAPSSPAGWQRVNIGQNRRYYNPATGETLSDRQFRKLRKVVHQGEATSPIRTMSGSRVAATALEPPSLGKQVQDISDRIIEGHKRYLNDILFRDWINWKARNDDEFFDSYDIREVRDASGRVRYVCPELRKSAEFRRILSDLKSDDAKRKLRALKACGRREGIPDEVPVGESP